MEMGNNPGEMLYPGTVTTVLDPQNFWMQIGTEESLQCFHDLERDIQQFCADNWTYVEQLDLLEAGQWVLVDSGQSEVRWKRGQVARVSSKSHKADIVYVDYGDTGQTKKENICVDFPDVFQEYPHQAIRCSLAGLQPIGKSWTSRGVKTFQKLTSEKEFRTLWQYQDNGGVVVSLYGGDSTDGRSLTFQLLDEDVALPYELNQAPEFARDVPAFVATYMYLQTEKGYGEQSEENTMLSAEDTELHSTPPSEPDAGHFNPASLRDTEPNDTSVSTSVENGFQDFYPFDSVTTHPVTSQPETAPVITTVRPPPGFSSKPIENQHSPGADRSSDSSVSSRSSRSPDKNSSPLSGSSRPASEQQDSYSHQTLEQNSNHSSISAASHPRDREKSSDLRLPDYYRDQMLTAPAFYQSPASVTMETARPASSGSPVKMASSPRPSCTGSPGGKQPVASPPQASPGSYSRSQGLAPGRYIPATTNDKNKTTDSLKLHMPQTHTPTKSTGPVQSTGVKPGPVSPDSPAIAGFDMQGIDHTQHHSSHNLLDRSHQERLMALREEAEDLAGEAQNEVSEMAILGLPTEATGREYASNASPDIFSQIAEEISTMEQAKTIYHRDPQMSPKQASIKDTCQKKEEKLSKGSGVPSPYLVDIDFTVAVKEALESGKTEGMENTKVLLHEIVELMKEVLVVRQLPAVLLLLLAKAIQEYNLFHVVIMETLTHLNDGMNIKDGLMQALKRQQEICIRVPPSSRNIHLDFVHVMGHIYKNAFEWSASNAEVQDWILITVEKWILFNNKATQSGQDKKEAVFLDCFEAFWEICGPTFQKHNMSFRSRLQQDMKQKILHEGVSRCTRERLLDILLTKLPNVPELTDSDTQTLRTSTMNSSCQIKPATLQKGTMTEEDDERFYNLSSIDDRWGPAPSTSSPTPVSQQYSDSGNRYQPGPQDSKRARNRGKQLSGIAMETPSTSLFSEDRSYTEDFSYTSESYFTPDQSFANDKRSAKNDTLDNVSDLNVSQNAVQRKDSTSKSKLSKSNVSNYGQRGDKSWADIAKQDKQASNSETKAASESVTKSKQEKTKSVVDWFDYEPSPEPEANPKETGRKKSGVGKTREANTRKETSTMMQIASEFLAKSQSPEEKGAGRVKGGAESDRRETVPKKTLTDCDSSKPSDRGQKKSGPDSSSNEPIDWWSIGEEESSTPSTERQGTSLPHPPGGGPEGSGGGLNGHAARSDMETEEQLPTEPAVTSGSKDQTDLEFIVDEGQFRCEEDSEEGWETESDDEDEFQGQYSRSSTYKEEFPASDFAVKVKPTEPKNVSVTGNEYSQDFPESDLSEFVRPPQKESPPPVRRWVPGHRKCTLCHGTDHLVYNCPQSTSTTLLF